MSNGSLPERIPESPQRGFSLVELLISLVLMSMVLAIVFTFVLRTGRSFNSEGSSREMQQSARAAIDELSRLIEQAGFGVDRPVPYNDSAWQRGVIHAAAHTFTFNADIDPDLGPIGSGQSLGFPGGETYAGQGAAATSVGAETYVFTVDANGDGALTDADRSAAASGSYNPAALTPNPEDFAVFEEVHGYDGSAYVIQRLPLAPHLFTDPTGGVTYADGTKPAPLFLYWVSEDLNRDGRLDPSECVNDVVDTCPPGAEREPLSYLWGDTNFDGSLSDSERSALISMPVGSTSWSKNPLVVSGAYRSTTLASAIDPSAADAYITAVANATGIAPGSHIRIGTGGGAETFVVESASTASSPDSLVLLTDPQNSHAAGDAVEILPGTLLRAIVAVQVVFTVISPRATLQDGAATLGQGGRATSHDMDYRTFILQKTIALPNQGSSATVG